MEAAAIWENIDTLKPWENNPRRNDLAVSEVMKSIKRFGFAAPIVARKEDAMIIAGHTRYAAAKALGIDKVPVRYLDLDPADSKLLALADNKLGEVADWDEDRLEEIIKELNELGADFEGIGFSEKELNGFFDDIEAESLPTDDLISEGKEEEPIQSKVGELYELGDHILVCGDWRDKDLRTKAFEKLKPTAGLHDPPYGIDVVSKGQVGGDAPLKFKDKGTIGGVGIVKAKKYMPIFEDDQQFDPTELLEVSPNSIIWGANYFADKLPNTKGWICWDKKGQDWEDNFSDGELAWTPFNKKLRIYRHIWAGLVREGARDLEVDRFHPTQKPVTLMAKIIKDYFPEEEVIADFYLGSGTTLIAASVVGKKCLGFEISPYYCDMIRKRWYVRAKQKGLPLGKGAIECDPQS